MSPALVASKLLHKDIGLMVNTYGYIRAEDHSSANVAMAAYLERPPRRPQTPTMLDTAHSVHAPAKPNVQL